MFNVDKASLRYFNVQPTMTLHIYPILSAIVLVHVSNTTTQTDWILVKKQRHFEYQMYNFNVKDCNNSCSFCLWLLGNKYVHRYFQSHHCKPFSKIVKHMYKEIQTFERMVIKCCDQRRYMNEQLTSNSAFHGSLVMCCQRN